MGAPVQDIYVRLDRFKSIDKDTGCWYWHGKKDKDGYGRIAYQGREVAVQRLAAFLYRGTPLGTKLLICHKEEICKNKNCWNPEHTFDGTYSENNTRTTCNRGHFNWYVNRRTGHRYCRTCIKKSPSRLRRLKSNA